MTDPAPQQVPQQAPTPQVQQTPAPQPQADPNASAQYWQSRFDSTRNELDTLKQQVQQMVDAQKAPAPQQAAPNASPQTADLDFTNLAAMRDENGNMKPEYADALFNKDTPAEVRNSLWQTVNHAQSVIDSHTNQQISDVFGDRGAFDNTYQTATQHLSPQEQQALAAALGNPLLMRDGLEKLKNMSEEKGWVAQQADQQQQTTEPPQVPHTSNPQSATSPLMPGSVQAKEAMDNPLYMEKSPAGDNYRKVLDERLSVGLQQRPDLTSMFD